MNAISAGTDELITENGVTIGVASSIVISVGTYSAQSLTYKLSLISLIIYRLVFTQVFNINNFPENW